MFGGMTFLINGHMCCGVTGNDLVVRLGPEKGTAALAQPHTRLMDFTGKAMKSMIFVEANGTASAKGDLDCEAVRTASISERSLSAYGQLDSRCLC